MPTENKATPGGRKSDLLKKDDDILDFAEEILGSSDDEEILDLEDDKAVSDEEEEDIIDLTEVASNEMEDEDEEEILDLTDELEEVPEDAVMELNPDTETTAKKEDILVSPPEDLEDTAGAEGSLELDDVADTEDEDALDVDGDLFALEDTDEDTDAVEVGSTRASFTVEADTIELSEADRNSLEEEFRYEPEPETSPADAAPETSDPHSTDIIEAKEPDIEVISVTSEDRSHPGNNADFEPESGDRPTVDDESNEAAEEIVLDFEDSPGEEAASGKAFFGAFEDSENEAAQVGEEPSPIPEKFDRTADALYGETAPETADSRLKTDDFTGSGNMSEAAADMIDDEAEDEEELAWPDDADTETVSEPWTGEQDSTDTFEEKTLVPEQDHEYDAEAGWNKSDPAAPDWTEPLAATGEEETDAPLSTEAVLRGDQPESITSERLEAVVEQAVNRVFSEKIEAILMEAIERSVSRELNRLKQLVLGDDDTGGNAA